jgi:hypothetical protein
MTSEWGDRQRLVGFTAAIVVVTIAASVGFQSITANPLVPDSTVEIADAPGDYLLNESGTSDMITVTHEGGDTMELRFVSVVIAPGRGALVFNASGGWSVDIDGLTFALKMDGQPVEANTTFGPDDVLTVSKTEGTLPRDSGGEFSVRVLVRHVASQTVVSERTVQVQ